MAKFTLEIIALPQRTAEVERTFSKVNANKTKLRNALSVYTLQGILQTSESYPANFEINERLKVLHRNARLSYMSRFHDEERSNIEMEEDFEQLANIFLAGHCTLLCQFLLKN